MAAATTIFFTKEGGRKGAAVSPLSGSLQGRMKPGCYKEKGIPVWGFAPLLTQYNLMLAMITFVCSLLHFLSSS